MSGHGEMPGEHGIYLKVPYFYDCAIRVPLMIRWPKRFKAGLKSDALVEMMDLAPTLLGAAGIPVTPGIQGKSLDKLLRGEPEAHRESVYMEYYDSGQLYDPPPMATSIGTKNRKMTVYHSLGTGELYDLERDPGEFNNPWSVAVARPMREEIPLKSIGRMADTVDPLPIRKSTF
jgi:arylsulfatase